MELYQLRVEHFQNVQEMFDLFFEYYVSIMIRVRFTKLEYRSGEIKWRYRRVVIHLAIDSITISHILLLGSRYSKWMYLNHFAEDLIMIKRIDILFIMLVFILICVDCIWLVTLISVRQYRFKIVELLDDCAQDVVATFNSREVKYLIGYFRHISFISGIMYKIIALTFLLWSVLATYYYYQWFPVATLNWYSVIIVPYFLICFWITLNNALRVMFIFMMHVFAMIRMFSLKMARCRILLRMARAFPVNSRIRISIFFSHYIRIYRQMTVYNDTIQQYLMAADLIIKFSISLYLIFYSKQERFGWFSYFCIYLVALLTIYLYSMYALMANFPSRNIECYKMLASRPARNYWLQRLDRNFSLYSYIRFNLRTGLFIQTISHNQLGFSTGRLYFITKFKYIEMMIINLVLMSLFYKQITL